MQSVLYAIAPPSVCLSAPRSVTLDDLELLTIYNYVSLTVDSTVVFT